MNTDEQDDLWRLLGHAKAPSVSPYFSRNVLRAIREEEQEKPRVRFWLQWRWLALSATACGLLVAAGLSFHAGHRPQGTQVAETESGAVVAPAADPTLIHPQPAQADPVAVLAQQVSASPDYQVINHLDELLASEETSVWLDK